MEGDERTSSDDDDAQNPAEYSAGSDSSDGDEDVPLVNLARAARKGPKFPGLKEIIPFDPRFKTVLSYRMYRLNRTSAAQGVSVTKMVGLHTGRLKSVMTNSFNGDKPLNILNFLAEFRKRCDFNNIPEGEALLLLPEIIKGSASLN